MIQSGKHLFLLVISIPLLTTSWSQVESTSKNKNQLLIPERQHKWINDFENIFTASEEATLDSLVNTFERATSNEIVVASFDSLYTTRENFDRFVLAIHNNWGVGKKGTNNGIVIGISAGLRKIRISNGYGIEKRITDLETKKIIEEIISPAFKNSDFFEGTKKGIVALISKLQ